MKVTPGSTDISTFVVLRQTSDGTEKTGATITDIDLQYCRVGSAPVAKIDATALAATDSAHADNKAIEIDSTDQPGLYRVDWPDAAFAAGAREVILSVKLSGCFTEHTRVGLETIQTGDAYAIANNGTYGNSALKTVIDTVDTVADAIKAKTDGLNFTGTDVKATLDGETVTVGTNNDKTGYALTAAYDAAKTAASQASVNTIDGIVDAILEDTGTTLPGTLTTMSGYIDTEVAAIKAKTDNLPADPADQSAVEAAITAAHATTDGKINAVDDYVDTEIAAIKAVTDKLDTAVELDGAVYRLTANALELAPVDGAAPTAAAIRAEIDANSTQLAAIKTKTDGLNFTGTDVKATLDGETVTVGTNNDKTGYALTAAYDAAKTAASQASVDTIDGIVDAILEDTGTTLPGTLTTMSGYIDTEVAAILAAVDTEVAAIKAKTDNLPADPADQSAVEAAITAAHTTTNSKIDAVDDYVDTEIAAIKAVTDKLDTAVELDGAVYRLTANALELAPVDGAAPTAAAIRAEIDANSTQLAAIKTKTDGLNFTGTDVKATLDGETVTVGTNNDKTGYALTVAYDAAKTASSQASVNTIDGIVDAILEDTGTTLPGTLTTMSGYIDTEVAAILAAVDTEVAAIKAKTDNLPADPADQSAVEAAITAAHATTDGKIDAVDDYVDTEIAAIKAVTDKLDTALELDSTVYRLTANALELAPVDGAAPTVAAIRAEIDANSTQLAAIKTKTDGLNFTGTDVKATLDGETVTVGTNNDKTGYALTAAYDAAKTAASQASVNTIDGIVDSILEDTGTTIPASLSSISGYIDTEVASILAAVDTEVAAIKAKTDGLNFTGTDVKATLDGETVTVGTNNDKTGYALTAAYDAAKAAASQSSVNTIDGIVDAILEDTGTTIPATLSTISGYIDTEVASILAAVDTEVAAIKAKTDNLPADPADQSAVEAAITVAHTTTNGKIDAVDDYVDTEIAAIKAVTDKLDTALELDEAVYRFTANALELAPVDGAAPTVAAIRAEIDANSEKLALLDVAVSTRTTLGVGGTSFTYTLTSTTSGLPILDADVWVTTDIAGQNVIARGSTDQNGQITFLLNPGTLYFWRRKSGFTFTNPDVEVIS